MGKEATHPHDLSRETSSPGSVYIRTNMLARFLYFCRVSAILCTFGPVQHQWLDNVFLPCRSLFVGDFVFVIAYVKSALHDTLRTLYRNETYTCKHLPHLKILSTRPSTESRQVINRRPKAWSKI